MHTLADISSALGTTWWTIVVFVAGALVGVPVFKWLSKYMPWNK